MAKIFIIHGSYGSPSENWFPWLKNKLESKGHQVFIPELPTPENQNLENWMKVFEDSYLKEVNEESIFVGHSIGPAFILSLLEKLSISKSIKACFFVSGFIGLLNNSEFDEINNTFTTKEFNWKKIKNNCKKFFVYHSDNDPYVPIEKSYELAEKLNTKPIIVKGAGHFNSSSGYEEFDILFNDLIKVLE